jgi:soluble lytic murein transglycosylase-like protein
MRISLQFIGALLWAMLLLISAISAQAGEYAVLGNGFRLHADRHETDGSVVRLYTEGGVTQVGASTIDHFEAEEIVPAKPHEVAAVQSAPAAKEALPAPAAQTPEELARQAAKKYSLPESFVRSVMKVESGLRQEATSPKGAMGLMQLMPDTARDLGVDPKDARQNAEGGAQYLRDLLARYENRPDQVLLALAAYNAGPGAVEHYHGVPPYRETRQYILRVLKYWDQSQKGN